MSAGYWDDQADTFDEEADHGLRDPRVRDAWRRLLLPGGTLVLIEGRWSTGAGLTTAEAGRAVLRQRADATVTGLDDPLLWGGPVSDERYLLVSRH